MVLIAASNQDYIDFATLFKTTFAIKVDIPGPLITLFRNGEPCVPRHFDHINSLTINCHFLNQLHKAMLYMLRNYLVKRHGMSIQGETHRELSLIIQ